jgi:S-adenosylmethionine:tRNA ribosyltransferase-isomerase
MNVGTEPELDEEIARFPPVPADRIAQEPPAERDAARLMTLSRETGALGHRRFSDLPELFRAGDVLVLNDTRVFPARLFGKKPTGGRVQALLLRPLAGLRGPASGQRPDGPAGPFPDGTVWASLLTPSMKPGAEIFFDEGLKARVLRGLDSGEYELAFSASPAAHAEKFGQVPLPPYIRGGRAEAADRARYQTVYARAGFAVAAPTAGLHFTDALLDKLRGAGVVVTRLRLDVGWGTFKPVKDPDYRRHRMLPEPYEVPAETAEAFGRARAAGGRVWAVGTTVTRALESAVESSGRLRAGAGETSLYITPGRAFRAVDALITNFHIPGYTPLLLAAAFAGTARLRAAYEAALAEGYRFFSYGDAMAIS